eukprot:CAMPEP_0197022862 /NCGR_PEP_ID=MMETSP1384-20130603/3660_1 /TAXON_ID=29189 /ORGANISM="Ammonia sp." /LENGTH=452 /DNA_ID=CAMNT_0042450973 /DNA_START=21 /DNA_END=1379 /DNA_ORIENTATION=+
MAEVKEEAAAKADLTVPEEMTIPSCLQPQNIQSLKVNLSEDLKLINPDIHELFLKYNKLFFGGEINFVEIKWVETKDNEDDASNNNNNGNNNNSNINNENKSPVLNGVANKKPAARKKKYAGKCLCDDAGFCCIELEKSILQFKSSKYLIETIVHQMIHSYILTKHGAQSVVLNKKQEAIGHSEQFKLIMEKINQISVPYIKLSLNNKQCKQNDDYPSEIIPNQLYLGNIHHALNLQTLKTLKITHVVNCTQSIENKFEAQGIGYCRVPVNDKVTESILHYFVKAIRFIESVRNQDSGKNDNRILIHCHAGISRSSSITIAYLMFSWKLTMFDAIAHVQSKRYIIQPNQGFKNQLLDFYLYLENNEGNLDDFEKKHVPKPVKQVEAPRPSLPAVQNGANSQSVAVKPEQNVSNNNNNNKGGNAAKEYVACPVCDKFFPPNYINKHLDECVSY